MLIVVILLIFAATTGGAYLLLGGSRRQASQTSNRLEALMKRSARGRTGFGVATGQGIFDKNSGSGGPGQIGLRPDILPILTSLLSGSTLGEFLRIEILRAGLRILPSELLIASAACSLGGSFAGYLFTHQIIFVIIGSVFGVMVPMFYVQQMQKKRRKRLESQIPDALTLIASSMRSGYSFLRAMKLVTDEMPVPISEEFGWVLGEVELGVSTQTALERMVTRAKSRDLELVIIAVTIQMQVGGNLAEILDTISETIRERFRIQGEISALTAEGKLSGIILFLLPLGLALMLQMRDPTYFSALLEADIGPIIVITALVLQILGGVVIKKMITLDV